MREESGGLGESIKQSFQIITQLAIQTSHAAIDFTGGRGRLGGDRRDPAVQNLPMAESPVALTPSD